MAGGGAGCGVGHVAHAVGCSFSFSPLFFVFFSVRSWRGGFGGVSVCGGTYYLPLSVRYALRCRFPFLGVENQPLGVVLGLWCGCERVLVDWWQGVGVTSCLLWVV